LAEAPVDKESAAIKLSIFPSSEIPSVSRVLLCSSATPNISDDASKDLHRRMAQVGLDAGSLIASPGDGARCRAESDDLMWQRIGNPLLIDPASAGTAQGFDRLGTAGHGDLAKPAATVAARDRADRRQPISARPRHGVLRSPKRRTLTAEDGSSGVYAVGRTPAASRHVRRRQSTVRL
jgi:hypothetical protein